ncbi:MAG: bifunctional 4-hydroxy-3-methylbut-2-enyl diphosphate reductase/30S ribosomal protein S1 [Clostridiales bacterium]|nr:bifunctional 4-hydroxy-3-methylbut-2-enyl diphosphate reductase/30S ribosomal protein S1 [Clostridiales bacterium]
MVKIETTRSAGFCFGVANAVEIANEVLDEFGEAYATGELIHNNIVMEKLKNKGLKVVPVSSKIPEGGHFIVRAHGEPPGSYESARLRKLIIHDATCSYVHHIQDLVKQLHGEAKKIIIFGNPEHPEIIGINGYCSNTAIIINDLEGIDEIKDNGEKYCLIAQTTANQQNYDRIFDILDSCIENIKKYDTICQATQKRQRETVELAKKADIMVVVGGKNSSNTKKLFDICRLHCVKTYWVEAANELSSDSFVGYNYIGITAGASTPDWIVKEVLEYMSEMVKQGESSEFENMLEASLVELRNGQLVTGKIISMNDKEVYVDVGFKIDGTIAIGEFPTDSEDKVLIKVGDEVEAVVVKVRDSEGVVYLSKKRADERKAYDKINDLFKDGEIFKAQVKEVVKGGLIVNVFGADGFMPASQVSDRFVRNLNKYVGRKLKVKIIENDRRRKKLIISARVVVEEENERLEVEVWSKVEKGSIINGRIKSLTNFGAFVDVGGIDGLLHITEMSWHKIKHPSDLFEVDQDVEVYVKDFDKDAKKISLGYRREEDNPWYVAEERYASGNVVKAEVVRILPFGAFVRLERGIDALVHISQISNKRLTTPGEVLKEGMEVEVAIIDIDMEKRKINASIKAVNPMDPVYTEEEMKEREEAEEVRRKSGDVRPNRKSSSAPRKRRPALRGEDRLPTSHREDLNNTMADLFAGLDIADEKAEVAEVAEEVEEVKEVKKVKETKKVKEAEVVEVAEVVEEVEETKKVKEAEVAEVVEEAKEVKEVKKVKETKEAKKVKEAKTETTDTSDAE